MLRRPKSIFGVNLSGKVGKQLLVSCNIISTGKREDAYFDNTNYATVYTTLESYILCDIYAEYSFTNSKLKIFTDLRNVTNSKYSEIVGFNTTGFTGYGGVRFSF